MTGSFWRKLSVLGAGSGLLLGGGCIGLGGDGLLQQLLVFALDTFVFLNVT